MNMEELTAEDMTKEGLESRRHLDLSVLLITLLKGVVYREDHERLWFGLLRLQFRVRESVSVLGLELILDEAEGYAFLKSRPDPEELGAYRLPRLIARRPLSYMTSLLLALLRKKLAEFDAAGGDTRLILSHHDMVDLLRVFIPENTNESRQLDQLDTHINRIVELGFLRRLKTAERSSNDLAHFEVRRILKAFVDAQWLGDFDAHFETYRRQLMEDTAQPEGKDDE